MHLASRGIKLPQAVGHEIFGTVAALGPSATAPPLGSPRIVYPWLGCGTCRRCAQGSDNLCATQKSLGVMQHGGMAEYVLVPSSKYLIDAGHVDPSVACTFGCSGITVLSAIRKVSPLGAELDPEDAVVLIGAGGLGLSAISMLRAVGHRRIVSLDISEEKLEAARQAGATATVNSSSADAAKEVLDAAGGPVLAVIDFVNGSKTSELAYSVLAKGGTMVRVGVMGGELPLSCVGMIFKAATIMGNNTGTVAHLQEVAKLAREGKLAAIPITVVPKDEANDALMKLRDGKVTGRMVLKY
jgi:propanol-preferring alcohol dehydrogenase